MLLRPSTKNNPNFRPRRKNRYVYRTFVSHPSSKPGFCNMKNAFKNILILLILAAVLAVVYWLIINYYDDKNRTDDAQVEGNIVPVLARTDGFVSSIFVDDDEYVEAGTVMVQLDTSDLFLQLKQALNALAVARTNLKRAEAGIEIAKSNYNIVTKSIEGHQAELKATQSNYERNSILKDKGVVSVQIYEHSEENYTKSKIDLQNAFDRQAQAKVGLDDAGTQLQLAKQNIVTQTNQIEMLRKNISYATVRAPVSGLVSKRKVQLGQMIRTGAQIFSIVQSNDLWVTANFKETQLAAFPIGQRVSIKVDAYPEEIFYGKVETIGGATGSKFALLPPDNATGNYVKVIQRVPVRISFEDTARAYQLLKPGFSVIVTK